MAVELPIMGRVRDLIHAYDEYAALLMEHEKTLLGLAYVHGYRTPHSLIEKGSKLRAKITELRSDIPKLQPSEIEDR